MIRPAWEIGESALAANLFLQEFHPREHMNWILSGFLSNTPEATQQPLSQFEASRFAFFVLKSDSL